MPNEIDLSRSINTSSLLSKLKEIQRVAVAADSALSTMGKQNSLDGFVKVLNEIQNQIQSLQTSGRKDLNSLGDSLNQVFNQNLKVPTQNLGGFFDKLQELFGRTLKLDLSKQTPELKQQILEISKELEEAFKTVGIESATKINEKLNADGLFKQLLQQFEQLGDIKLNFNQVTTAIDGAGKQIQESVQKQVNDTEAILKDAKSQLIKAYKDYYDALIEADSENVDILSGATSPKMDKIADSINEIINKLNLQKEAALDLKDVIGDIQYGDLDREDIAKRVNDIFKDVKIDSSITESLTSTLTTGVESAKSTTQQETTAITNSYQEMAESVEESAERIQKAYTKIMYHKGDLVSGKGSARDTFEDTLYNLSAAAEGSSLERYGFGNLGGGLFGVTNPQTIPKNEIGSASFIQSIDLSKYNMYLVETEERATQLITFLSQLQKFAVKSAVPEYKGFDEFLGDTTKDSLFSNVQQLFPNITYTREQFSQFVDSMVSLLKEAGASFNKEENQLKFNNITDKLSGSDNISTRFLKSLGYEGVNVGNTSLDGFGQGSVLFDFKKEDIVGYFNTIEQAVEDYKKVLSSVDDTSWTKSNEQIKVYQQNLDEIIQRISEYKSKFAGLQYESVLAETISKISEAKAELGKATSVNVQPVAESTTTVHKENAEAIKAETVALQELNAVKQEQPQPPSNEREIKSYEDVVGAIKEYVEAKKQIKEARTSDLVEDARFLGDSLNLHPDVDSLAKIKEEFEKQWAYVNQIKKALKNNTEYTDKDGNSYLGSEEELKRQQNILTSLVSLYAQAGGAVEDFKFKNQQAFATPIFEQVKTDLASYESEVKKLDELNAPFEKITQSIETALTDMTNGSLGSFASVLNPLWEVTNASIDEASTKIAGALGIIEQTAESEKQLASATAQATEQIAKQGEATKALSEQKVETDSRQITSESVSSLREIIVQEQQAFLELNSAVQNHIDSLVAIINGAITAEENLFVKSGELITQIQAESSAVEELVNQLNNLHINNEAQAVKELETYVTTLKAQIKNVVDTINTLQQLTNIKGEAANTAPATSEEAKKKDAATQLVQTLEQEKKAFEELNNVLNSHVSVLEGAVTKENEKQIASQSLVGQLGAELQIVKDLVDAWTKYNQLAQPKPTSPPTNNGGNGGNNNNNNNNNNNTYKHSRSTIKNPATTLSDMNWASIVHGENPQQILEAMNQLRPDLFNLFKNPDSVKIYDTLINDAGEFVSSLVTVRKEVKETGETIEQTFKVAKNSKGNLVARETSSTSSFKTSKWDPQYAYERAQSQYNQAVSRASGLNVDLKPLEQAWQTFSNGTTPDNLEAFNKQLLLFNAHASEIKANASAFDPVYELARATESFKQTQINASKWGIDTQALEGAFNALGSTSNKEDFQSFNNELELVKANIQSASAEANKFDAHAVLTKSEQDFNNVSQKAQRLGISIQDLSNAYNRLKATTNGTTQTDFIKELDKVKLAIKDFKNLPDLFGPNTTINVDRNNIQESLEGYFKQFAEEQNNAIIKSTSFNATTGILTGTIQEASGALVTYKIATNEQGNALKVLSRVTKENENTLSGWKTSIVGGLKSFKSLAMAVTGFYGIRSLGMQIKKGIQDVRQLDLALTELRKVTEGTSETYDNFLEGASQTAARIGTTITDFTNATADFARLGYSINEASKLAEAASIYKNVGDEIKDVAEATESIISTMKAFGIETEGAMDIVSRFNEVGNNFAISSAGIGTALAKSASALNEAGNTIDESIALITAGNTVVQNPEQVGTALKTLSLRIRGAKVQLEEAGLETDNMAESVSQLQAKLLALTGGQVDILSDKNTFKSTTQILREISAVWDQMSDISRAASLELLGGKRQANILSAIISNFDIVEDAIKSSMNSAGSALKENEKYLDSIQGKVDLFNNALQTMWSHFIDSDTVKSVISFFTQVIQFLDKLGAGGTVAFGILLSGITSVVGSGLTTWFKALGTNSPVPLFTAIGKSLTGLAANAAAAGKALWAAIASNPVLSGAIAIAGVLTAIAIVVNNKLNPSLKTLKERWQETNTELNATQDEINRLTSEMEKLDEQIESIQSKGKLSFTDEEELKRLQYQRGELEKEKSIQDQILEAQKKQNSIAATDVMEKIFSSESAGEKEIEGTMKTIGSGLGAAIGGGIGAAIVSAIGVATAPLTGGLSLGAAAAIIGGAGVAGGLGFGKLFEGAAYEEAETPQEWADSYIKAIEDASERVRDAREKYLKDTSNEKNFKKYTDAQQDYTQIVNQYAGWMEELQTYAANSEYGFNDTVDKYIDDVNLLLDAFNIDNHGKNAKLNFFDRIFNDDNEKLPDQIKDVASILQELFDDNALNAEILGLLLDKDLGTLETVADEWNKIVGYGTKGNVDYNLRPYKSPEEMQKVYPEFKGDVATTYTSSSEYELHDGTKISILATPILENTGDILSEETLNDYLDSILGDTLEETLANDANDLKLIVSTQVEGEGEGWLTDAEGNSYFDWDTFNNQLVPSKEAHLLLTDYFNPEELEIFNSWLERAGVNAEDLWNYLSKTGEFSLDILSEDFIPKIQSLSDLTTALDKYSEAQAMASSLAANNTQITEDQFKAISELIDNTELLSQCIDANNGYVITNIDLLKSLLNGVKQQTREEIKLSRSQARLRYKELTKQLKDFTSASDRLSRAQLTQYESTFKELNMLERTIAQYDMLEQKLLGVADAYDRFAEAQNLDKEINYDESASTMLTTLISGLEHGMIGTESVRAAWEGLIPESVYEQFDNIEDRAEAAWKYITQTLPDLFTYEYDDEGYINGASIKRENVENFVKKAQEANVFTGEDFTEFDINVDAFKNSIPTIEEMAEKLGMTKEAVFAFITECNKYNADWLVGKNGNLFDSFNQGLESDIYNTTNAIADLKEQMLDLYKAKNRGDISSEDFKTKNTEIQNAIKEQEAELEKLDFQATTKVNSYEVNKNSVDKTKKYIEETTQEINDLKKQLKELEKEPNPYVARYYDTEKRYITGYQKIQETKQKLEEAERALDGYSQHLYEVLALTETPSVLEIEAALSFYGIEPEDIDNALANITQEINDYIADNKDNFSVSLEIDPETGELLNDQDIAAQLSVNPATAEDSELLSLLQKKNTIELYIDTTSGEERKYFEEVIQSAENAYNAIEKLQDNYSINTNSAVNNLQRVINKAKEVRTQLSVPITQQVVTVGTTFKKNSSGQYSTGIDPTLFANGTAHARGNWGLQHNEHHALVGELGPETVVDPASGRYYTVGDHGAEFVDLPQHAIVFNHKQTEDLFKHGYITSRGRALAEGNAFATTIKPHGPVQNAINGSGSYDSSDDSSSDDVEQTIDFIERRIEKIESMISKTSAKLENFIDDTTDIQNKNLAYEELIQTEWEKVDTYLGAAQVYNTKAEQYLAEIPEEYRDMAKNGAIAITDFIGEEEGEIAEAIENYREYAEKADQAEISRLEAIAQVSQYRVDQIQDIASDFDNVNGLVETQNNLIKSEIDIIEASGERTSEMLYRALIGNAQQMLPTYYTQLEVMTSAFEDAVTSGDLIKGSDDWYEAYNNIMEVEEKINQCNLNTIEWQHTIDQLKWDNLDKFIDELDSVKSQLSHLHNIFADEEKTFDEFGNWTADGTAALGMLAQQMELAQYTSKQYGEAIRDLKSEHAAGKYSEDEYNEKLAELTEKQWASIEAYNQAKESIVSLNKARINAVKDGLQKEIDAYRELIEAKKESLKADKDARDFNKTVAEQRKNIATIEKQIAAIAGDTSAAATAKRKQLQADLIAAQMELDETYYDHSVETQIDALDKELENYEKTKNEEIEALEDWAKDTERVVQEALEHVRLNATDVLAKVNEVSNTYGIQISDAIVNPWKNGSSAISDYSASFSAFSDSFIRELNEIKRAQEQIVANANASAQTVISNVSGKSDYLLSLDNPPPKTEEPATTQPAQQTQTQSNTKPGLVSGLSGYIQYGDTGEKVVALQTALTSLGYSVGSPGIDGIFGDYTYAAVQKFQRDSGIAVDGIVGPDTKEQFRLRGYAKGSRGIKNDQLAILDELGEELQLVPDGSGRLAYIKKGTGILNHELTERLMDWGELDPREVLKNSTPASFVSHINNNTFNVDLSFGSLVTVGTVTQDTLPELQKMVRQEFDDMMKQVNNRLYGKVR